jgi:DNA-binding transcriptional ArsR family regulator
LKKNKTTSKSKTQVGNETLYRINEKTGEYKEVHCQIIEQEVEKDTNFVKVWLGHMLAALDEIGNKKIEVVKFILENMDKRTNLLIMTQKEISEKSGVSYRTVNRTIKALEEADFLTPKGAGGVYYIFPGSIFRGGHKKRMNVLYKYYEAKHGSINKQKKASKSAEDAAEDASETNVSK